MNGLEGLIFGIHVHHGAGLLHFPDPPIRERAFADNLAAVVYVDDDGIATEVYPFNLSNLPGGLIGVTSSDSRHFATMPYPERCFFSWQAHWPPDTMPQDLTVTPWLRTFQNASEWCGEAKDR